MNHLAKIEKELTLSSMSFKSKHLSTQLIQFSKLALFWFNYYSHSLWREGLPKKSHILQLRLTGRFAINVVDDIIIVHHQTSQTSLLFDIRFPSSTTQGDVTYHLSIVPPYTIKPFKLDDSDFELCKHHLGFIFYKNINNNIVNTYTLYLKLLLYLYLYL